jgi:starch synthase
LDLASWNPAADKALKLKFDAKTLAERYKNKLALLKEVGFPADKKMPLLCVITRMDHQKGIELALQALRMLAEKEWQAVILGTGDEWMEDQARLLSQDYPEKVKSIIRYDDALARRMYGGSDMILIPSRYEPCGLTQMIGMRYGCVPVARATGGLRDTIVDYDFGKDSTGFLFEHTTPESLVGALNRALDVYADQRRWRGLQLRGMRQDFSWEKAARQYLALYHSLNK